MANESTGPGAALLDRVESLGFPRIGRSRQGRAIVASCHGDPATRGGLVLMAGIHGDEGSSVEAMLELLASPLPEGPRPLWVVPALNPDGLLVATKNSAANVDLNRNFPARNFTAEHAPGYDPGPAALSEPESAAFAELLDRVAPAAVVTVHAPFACINYDGPAADWAQAVADACGWPARGDLGYPTPGSLGSWLGVDRGLPVLTIELPPGAYPAFRPAAQRALLAAVKGPPR